MGIVVLGATNRPEVLDPALLRPGRFDRQVTIPLPNVSEREAILRVHTTGKKLAPDVDLGVVARGTPGFSGADLANLANEAAIFAVRDDRDVVTADDFFAARDRIILGRREGLERAAPRGEARGGGARVRARAGGGAVRARRPGGQGDDPARRADARRHRAAPAGGAAHVRRGLPARLARRPARRPRRRARRPRPGLDRRGQRPGRRDRPGDQDGPRVRHVHGARPGGLPRRRLGVPRRRRAGHVEPAVRGGDPGRDRPRGLQAAPAGRGPRGQAAQDPPARARLAGRTCCIEKETVDGVRRLPAGGPSMAPPRQVSRAPAPAAPVRPDRPGSPHPAERASPALAVSRNRQP